MAVMSLDNLYIDVIAKHGGGGFQQLEAQIHAHRVVWREADRHLLAGSAQPRLLFIVQTGGTDDQTAARLTASLDVARRRFRDGEIDEHISLIRHRGKI